MDFLGVFLDSFLASFLGIVGEFLEGDFKDGFWKILGVL
jgi:hypothetical protein